MHRCRQRAHSFKAEDFTFCIARFQQAIGVESKAVADGKMKCSPLVGRVGIQPKRESVQATEAAVAFGQDDDITVLTLPRLAIGEKSTTSLLAPGLAALDA